MKNSIWKKGLTLAIAAMVLTTSVSLPADAAAAAPVAETQEAQPGGEAAPAEEAAPAAQVEEAAPAAEAAGQTETITRRRYRRLRRRSSSPGQAPVRIKIHPVTTTAAHHR